jgi:DNA-binding transcriptional regulator YiaG
MQSLTDRVPREKPSEWISILRAFRKTHCLTQENLAALLPTTSKRNVQDWEQGIHKPPQYLKRAIRDLERQLSGEDRI